MDLGCCSAMPPGITADPWQDWAARLVPTVTLEAVIAWLDSGQPDPDRAAEHGLLPWFDMGPDGPVGDCGEWHVDGEIRCH
jgi:hypothetical protein